MEGWLEIGWQMAVRRLTAAARAASHGGAASISLCQPFCAQL